jgi:hypothetical protein
VDVLLYGMWGLVGATTTGTLAYLWGWERGYVTGWRHGRKVSVLLRR